MSYLRRYRSSCKALCIYNIALAMIIIRLGAWHKKGRSKANHGVVLQLMAAGLVS